MTEGKRPSPPPAAKRTAKPAPPERPRGGEARRIADLVPEAGRVAFRRFGFVQSSVVTRWGEIVGERYAAVSAPESIRFPVGKRAGGTLELMVAGAHAPMLQMVIPDIIERVNRFFGYAAVAKVRMRQGMVAPPARPAAPPSPRNGFAGDIGAGLKAIADPELAAVLGSLAMKIAGGNAIEPLAPPSPTPQIARNEATDRERGE